MEINQLLAKKLISSQFPQWEALLIQPVKQGGWDNRTFHLGEEMTIRLPSAEAYAPQILKECHWLPILAKKITYQITTPLALGQPCEDFPWHWSVNRWIEGETASVERIKNLSRFAQDLGAFLTEFQSIAWNLFSGDSRTVFQKSIPLDKNTWIRALGWTFWKTLCWPIKGTDVKRIIQDIFDDYQTKYR